MLGKQMTEVVKEVISKHVKPSDTVVDATIGNGFDTLFLAEKVAPNGKVYGFDIQNQAIQITTEKLKLHNLLHCVELIQDSHENMTKYIMGNIKACLFNLGYLPNSDKSIITKKESTIKAIDSALKILEPKGIISILCYYGHEGGLDEKIALEDYLQILNSKKYDVVSITNINRLNSPPILYFVKKY